MYDSKPYFYGTGRRKSSVARVRVYAGTGTITVNGRSLDEYFGLDTLKLIVRQPLVLTETEKNLISSATLLAAVLPARPALSVTALQERCFSTTNPFVRH